MPHGYHSYLLRQYLLIGSKITVAIDSVLKVCKKRHESQTSVVFFDMMEASDNDNLRNGRFKRRSTLLSYDVERVQVAIFWGIIFTQATVKKIPFIKKISGMFLLKSLLY